MVLRVGHIRARQFRARSPELNRVLRDTVPIATADELRSVAQNVLNSGNTFVEKRFAAAVLASIKTGRIKLYRSDDARVIIEFVEPMRPTPKPPPRPPRFKLRK